MRHCTGISLERDLKAHEQYQQGIVPGLGSLQHHEIGATILRADPAM